MIFVQTMYDICVKENIYIGFNSCKKTIRKQPENNFCRRTHTATAEPWHAIFKIERNFPRKWSDIAIYPAENDHSLRPEKSWEAQEMVCEMRYSVSASVFISHRKLTVRSSVNGQEMVMFGNTTKMSRTHAPRNVTHEIKAHAFCQRKRKISHGFQF